MSKDLPIGWAVASLSELVTSSGIMCDGDWVESKDQDPEGAVRLIQLADVGAGVFIDKSNRYLTEETALRLGCTFLQEGDVLISRLGDPLGKTCIFPKADSPCVTVVDVHIFRSGSKHINHRWLMHMLNTGSIRQEVEADSSGTTRKRITGNRLKSLSVPIPPHEEQNRIASRIDELFSSIEDGERALERARKLVERYRQSVLKAAVTGELTREWREKNKGHLESGETLLSRILKARREAWEKSELAKMKAKNQVPANDAWKKKYVEPIAPDIRDLHELPEGWAWTRLGQLFNVSVGATPSRKVPEYWNGDIPWVSSGEVAFCRIKNTEETISILGLENSSVKMVPKGSVLLAMIGEGKTRGQAAILDIDAGHNQNASSIWVSQTPIPAEYIFFFLLFRYESVRRIGQGGNQPALNGDLVKRICIPLPPLEEIKEICRLLDVQMEELQRIESNIQSLTNRITLQRNSILREAFRGRLVPQDPSDEPAPVLLNRIVAERAQAQKKTAPAKGRRKKATA